MNPRITKDFNKLLIDTLQDPVQAAAYLQVAIEEYQTDNNLEVFLLALRNIAEVHGGLTKLAEDTGLNRQNLYKTLSREGNPRLSTLVEILNNLGFKLVIQIKKRSRRDS